MIDRAHERLVAARLVLDELHQLVMSLPNPFCPPDLREGFEVAAYQVTQILTTVTPEQLLKGDTFLEFDYAKLKTSRPSTEDNIKKLCSPHENSC